MIWLAIISLLTSFLLDLVLGDPAWMYHPVRIIGKMISLLEDIIRRLLPKTYLGEIVGGFILAFLIPAISFLIVYYILQFVGKINVIFMIVLEIFMCYQMLAAKSLKVESDRVKNQLLDENIVSARRWLSYIVGRDTKNLNKQEIIKATVETIAENTSDGVIAPIFYIAIMGAPMCYLYKAVNTLDSMVGYKNHKYKNFGMASARLDDLLNYIPSRLSGIFMVIASFICGFNYKGSYKIFLRDRQKHPSPNSAQTESACAGALDIQLGGGSYYGGIYKEKDTIGESVNIPEINDIDRAQKLMMVSSLLFCVFMCVFRVIIISFL